MTRWSCSAPSCPLAGSKPPTGLAKVVSIHPGPGNVKCLFPFQHGFSFPPISHELHSLAP